MSGSMRDFGRFVREAREKSGHSQLSLGVALGFSGGEMISKIETGRKKLPSRCIKKLAEALEVSETDVVGRMLEIERSRIGGNS